MLTLLVSLYSYAAVVLHGAAVYAACGCTPRLLPTSATHLSLGGCCRVMNCELEEDKVMPARLLLPTCRQGCMGKGVH